MELPAEVTWDDSVKKRIKDAVLAEVGKVRVCQKVFPTRVLPDGPTDIPFDALALPALRIPEGRTRPFVELYVEFPLTATQVQKETERRFCETLSRMAAKALALAEDKIIFQGDTGALPANVQADPDQKASTGVGLLGDADAKIVVHLAEGALDRVIWGEETFKSVVEGISVLNSKAQAPDYALFLPTRVYADTFAPPGNQSLVTTADRIRPLVEGGFHGTDMLPEQRGLLVSLGGEPTILYVGRETDVEFVRKAGSEYFFRAVERIQFVPRDPRALIRLEFTPPPPRYAAASAVGGSIV